MAGAGAGLTLVLLYCWSKRYKKYIHTEALCFQSANGLPLLSFLPPTPPSSLPRKKGDRIERERGGEEFVGRKGGRKGGRRVGEREERREGEVIGTDGGDHQGGGGRGGAGG